MKILERKYFGGSSESEFGYGDCCEMMIDRYGSDKINIDVIEAWLDRYTQI